MADTRRIHVVTHTHWDREWYSPFELFRMRLVRLVDRLLDHLEEDPDYVSFLLDAQTVVLDDYLAIRPERRDRLAAQIAAGRIEVGPWYVQPDQFLVSGESLVRNFLTGRRIALRLGAPGGGLRVGYLPDMFGHISQIPQLLRGFGIDCAICWRGISGTDAAPEFIWRSPDGSEVLTVHLPDATGYSMAHRLARDPAAALKQLAASDNGPGARTPHRLMLVGSDHVEPQRGLPELLAAIAALPDAPAEVRHGGLGGFFDRLREHLRAEGVWQDGQGAARHGLPVREGELRDTNRSPQGRFNFLLPNVLSSRAALKLQNAEVERELTVWAEPLAALARCAGAASEQAFLHHAWETLLQNHPHDSIGGCSRDEVHRQMPARFESALQVARQVGDESAARLAAAMDTSGLPEEGRLILVINPTAVPRRGVVDVSVDLPQWFWRDLEVTDANGARVPAQVVSSEQAVMRTTGMPDPDLFPVVVTHPQAAPGSDSGWFTAFEQVRTCRMRLAADLPGLGYATYRVRPVTRGRVNVGSLRTGSLSAANGVLSMELSSSGDLFLTHLNTGRAWRGCLRLRDGGDAGDGYTYSPPPEDAVLTWRPESMAVVEDGPVATTFRLEGDFRLPRALEADRQRRAAERVGCPVQIDLTLAAGAAVVEGRLRFTNWARDHRLRLVAPTHLETAWSVAESQWDIIRRPTVVRHPDEAVWIEDASTCHPTHGFVDASEGAGGAGFAVFSFGLREFELTTRGEICLTVLRAVGYLGAHQPLTIANGAGPQARTPDAQMVGETVDVRFGLVPHGPGADLWPLSQAWKAPCRAYPQSRHGGTRPARGTWVGIPEGVDVSSLKEAEDGSGVVLRLFNPGDVVCAGRVALGLPVSGASRVRLDEEPIEDLALGTDGAVEVAVPPKGLVSIRWTPTSW